MKNFLLIAFLCLSLTTYAQFTKGDVVLGGSFSFSDKETPFLQTTSAPYKTHSISASPSFGWLLSENFSLGVLVGYELIDQHPDDPQLGISTYRSEFWSGGLYARRYFTVSDKLLFTLTGTVDYSMGQVATSFYDPIAGMVYPTETENYEVSLEVTPGFLFFPVPKWGFEARIGSVGYSHGANITNDVSSSEFNLSYGTITLGVAYYFRKAGN